MIRLKQLIIEDTLSFPIVVSGTYQSTTGNCDRLHAFNDTHGIPVGGMNNKVNAKLIEVYNAGYNPDIANINVKITKNGTDYTVNWSVTINKSTDGNAWVGLYSRGHGGRGVWVFNNVSTQHGHASIGECKKSKAIANRGTVDKMVLVHDYEYNKDGKISGCQVNQLFYKYTLNEKPKR